MCDNIMYLLQKSCILREYRALWRRMWDLLRECRALLIGYRTLSGSDKKRSWACDMAFRMSDA